MLYNWKKGLVWFGIYIVGLMALLFSGNVKPQLGWGIVRFLGSLLCGGLVGMLIAKASYAEHYKKIIDRIYENERE